MNVKVLLQMPEFWIAVGAVFNVIIVILLSIIGFIAKRIFQTNDKQYAILNEVKNFIHAVDKRLAILETKHQIHVIKSPIENHHNREKNVDSR